MPATATADEVLSKKQLSEINKALSAVDRYVQLCDLATQCNVDCTQQLSDLDEIRQTLNTFKSTFFPNAK